MLICSRMELIFLVLFGYLKNVKDQKLKKAVDTAASSATASLPVTMK